MHVLDLCLLSMAFTLPAFVIPSVILFPTTSVPSQPQTRSTFSMPCAVKDQSYAKTGLALPSVFARVSLCPWSTPPTKSVFVYLGAFDHTGQSVILGGGCQTN